MRYRFHIFMLLAALGACTGPPAGTCLQGVYRLNLDDDVRLWLGDDRFVFTVANGQVVGTFAYDEARSQIALTPTAGAIGTASRQSVEAKSGIELSVEAFFASMEVGHQGYAYRISRSLFGKSVILDIDPDLRFIKNGC